MNKSLESVKESANAHREATGHDRMDATVVNHFPKVIVVTCSECGQHLGRATQESQEVTSE